MKSLNLASASPLRHRAEGSNRPAGRVGLSLMRISVNPPLRGPAQKRHPVLVVADVAPGALGFEAGLAQTLEHRGLGIV